MIFSASAFVGVTSAQSLDDALEAARERCSQAGGEILVEDGFNLRCACPDGSTLEGDSCPGSPDDESSSGGGAVTVDKNPYTEEDCNREGGVFEEGKCLLENDCEPEPSESLDQENCGIIRYIVMFINVLSAMVGIVVVASIIVGGIQYSSAGSDPQKVSAAKNRIRNAIIALLFFVFGYALLNYLVPGGVL